MLYFTNWIADGTFRSCPSLFYQSYTIHVMIEDKATPCLFILLPDKKQGTYIHMFNVIYNLLKVGNNLPVFRAPVNLMIDFEIAVFNAFIEVFQASDISVSYCFFHLCQSIQRQVNVLGFKKLYKSDKVFCKSVRMLKCLAFVPLRDVDEIFDNLTVYILSLSKNYLKFLAVLRYFERTYLGRADIDFKASIFNVKNWNYFEKIVESAGTCIRTSNAVEGWHRSFNALVGCKKPMMYIYLNSILEVQAEINFRLDRLDVGITPSKRRRLAKVTDRNESLYSLVTSYDNYDDKLKYLDVVSKLFHN